MDDIKIIIPKGATTKTEQGLVKLTEALEQYQGLETAVAGLGGKYGYGAEFENETFMMHPYCWCEKETCKWCAGDEPNFVYKPTRARIWWYKWIGRSQEKEGLLPKDWLKVCIESIKAKKI